MERELKDLVYGKDDTERIVCVENKNDKLILFIQNPDGTLTTKEQPSEFWLLTAEQISSKQTELAGDQIYKYLGTFPNMKVREDIVRKLKKEEIDYYRIYDQREQSLIYKGMTYYKGMKPNEVSSLSFDIETNSLRHLSTSRILIISNTFRLNGQVTRKIFALDDYEDDEEMMISQWLKWVREINPSIMLGHNIMAFDIPYLRFRCKELGIPFRLGRDNSAVSFDMWESSKRVDGTQTIEYVNAHIFGRELVDTMFLAITYDALKKFPNFQLKGLIRYLGYEKSDRTFVNAARIGKYYEEMMMGEDATNWQLAKQYAEEDSDDALKLFDEFVPAYFYFTQSVSKSFQGMINSATGSQINNMMVRSYLQIGHSIAKATEFNYKVKGGISFAVPAVYSNVFKIDIKSCYPSQILRFKLFDEVKDPNAHFYKIVHFFTYQRFEYKAKYKETGDGHYKDLDAAAKIVINSSYGVTITVGLNYNCPHIGEKITAESRAIIDMALVWASGSDSKYWFKIFREKTGQDPDAEDIEVDNDDDFVDE